MSYDNYNEQTAELLGAVPTSYEVTSRDDWGPFFGSFEDTYEPVYSDNDNSEINLLDRDISSYREQFPRATLAPDFSNVPEAYSPPSAPAPSNFFTDLLFGKQANGANTPYPGGPFLGQNFGGAAAGRGPLSFGGRTGKPNNPIYKRPSTWGPREKGTHEGSLSKGVFKEASSLPKGSIVFQKTGKYKGQWVNTVTGKPHNPYYGDIPINIK